MEEYVVTNSSTVQKILYDDENTILTVDFHSGDSYDYLEVPKYIYYEFINSDSKGKFVHQKLKGVYEFVKY